MISDKKDISDKCQYKAFLKNVLSNDIGISGSGSE